MLLCLVFLFVCKIRFGESLIEGYVYGGSYPKLQTYPNSAFLSVSCRRSDDNETAPLEWLCGASIVHKQALLTAAHCMDSCISTVLVAATGNSPDRRFTFPSKDLHLHEGFESETLENDIAIVELAGSGIIFSDVIYPAILQPHLRTPVSEGLIAGWGFVTLTERRAGTVLKQTLQSIFTRALCVELLGPMPAADFCAGNNYVLHHAATDAGSPLLVEYDSGYLQVGFISYQMPEVTKAVHIFTFIPMYYEWIQEKIHQIHSELDK